MSADREHRGRICATHQTLLTCSLTATNSSLHHPLSHSPSGSWADTIEEQVIEEEAPLAWGSSDDSEDDNMVDEVDDSLMDAAPHAVEAVALEELGLMPYQQQKDRPDIWASPAFNRPLLGTENDRGKLVCCVYT